MTTVVGKMTARDQLRHLVFGIERLDTEWVQNIKKIAPILQHSTPEYTQIFDNDSRIPIVLLSMLPDLNTANSDPEKFMCIACIAFKLKGMHTNEETLEEKNIIEEYMPKVQSSDDEFLVKLRSTIQN